MYTTRAQSFSWSVDVVRENSGILLMVHDKSIFRRLKMKWPNGGFDYSRLITVLSSTQVSDRKRENKYMALQTLEHKFSLSYSCVLHATKLVATNTSMPRSRGLLSLSMGPSSQSSSVTAVPKACWEIRGRVIKAVWSSRSPLCSICLCYYLQVVLHSWYTGRYMLIAIPHVCGSCVSQDKH